MSVFREQVKKKYLQNETRFGKQQWMHTKNSKRKHLIIHFFYTEYNGHTTLTFELFKMLLICRSNKQELFAHISLPLACLFCRALAKSFLKSACCLCSVRDCTDRSPFTISLVLPK